MPLKVQTLRFAGLIPVYRMQAARNGQPYGKVVELATPIAAARYLYAPNAEMLLKRKTGEVVQINLYPASDDSDLASRSGSPSSTYEEHLVDSQGAEHSLTVLKRVSRSGGLVRWTEKDRFTRGRFNPDLVQTSEVRAFSKGKEG